jgi:type II secretory pathway predicted ATPase ExeA
MYPAHFGLQQGLFGDGIAVDTAVYRSPKHDRIIANFKVAFAAPSAVAVLRGPAGVGKTTLTSAALRASSTRIAIAWLNGTPTNATELLELLLVELGINTQRTSRIERLQLWRQFQAEMSATDSRLFVVTERTEDLAPEVLRALDSLTSADAAGHAGVNVVLLGGPGLDRHLAAPALDSLRQRIRLRAQLEPFSEAELQDYLRHQVACAGGHYDRVFAPGVVAALYRYSGGVARLANSLCETALGLAASRGQPSLTAETVGDAAVSLLGLAEPAAAPTVEPATIMPAAAPAAPRAAAPAAPAAPAAVFAATPAPSPAPTAVASPPPAVPPAAPAPSPRVVAPAPTAAPAAAAAPAPTPKSDALLAEFDGGETDIPDVSMNDFPVLTDAVEMPVDEAPVPKRPALTPSPAATASAPPSPPAAPARPPPAPAPPPPARAATPTPKRIETAYAAPRPAPAAAPAPAPKPAVAAAPAAAPPAPKPVASAAPPPKPAATNASAPKPAGAAPPAKPARDSQDDDLLRQTQTMRAISQAKSIEDISTSMAETLFGDAELDLLSAALASAASWPEADASGAAPAPQAPAPTPKTQPRPSAADDPFDLFGLGEDAPLELIDDSGPHVDPARKTATQR